MPELAASSVLWPDRTLAPGVVTIEDGTIVGVRAAHGRRLPDRILAPGFVDLQVNGHGTVDVAAAEGDDWDELDRRLVAQGVTGWLPTLITSRAEAREAAIRRIAAATDRRGARPRILGIHLEGPWIGARTGAHRPDLVRPLTPSIVAGLHPLVRLVTVCPAGAEALLAIDALAEAGIVVSLGHSDADMATATAAVDRGARMVTHVFNAAPPLHHRAPGLVGAALADDRVAVSVIADGVHLHPALLRVVARSKGPGGVVLVTDAVGWEAPAAVERGLRLVDGAPRNADGVLAGSALTMDGAIRTMVGCGAMDLATALDAASAVPCRVLGDTDCGTIAVGRRADLVALSPDLAIEQVWIDGEEVHRP